MLHAICIPWGTGVKFEFASIVIYQISTTWISTEPGLVH